MRSHSSAGNRELLLAELDAYLKSAKKRGHTLLAHFKYTLILSDLHYDVNYLELYTSKYAEPELRHSQSLCQ